MTGTMPIEESMPIEDSTPIEDAKPIEIAGGVEGSSAPRASWLDGVRALAASYVVLHHVWHQVYPGFPDNNGPWAAGFLVYAHLAVAVFIVVSGYSLTMAPARRGLRLKGGWRGFARSRAWRILPPYWAAIVVSFLIIDLITAPRTGSYVGAKSFVVHFFLLQDITYALPPNGAFWSIAVECQIYLLFPVMLLLARRWGTWAVVALATAGVCFAYEIAIHVPSLDGLNNLTPQFLALFCFGMLAATASVQSKLSRLPFGLTLGLIVGAVGYIVVFGPRTVVAQYFWIDLAVGAITAIGFVQLAGNPAGAAGRLLAAKPLVWLGHRSYSLYLIHAPLVLVVWLYLVKPLDLPTDAGFVVMLVACSAVCVSAAFLFHRWIEKPFLVRRSWRAWMTWARRSPTPTPAFAGIEATAATGDALKG